MPAVIILLDAPFFSVCNFYFIYLAKLTILVWFYVFGRNIFRNRAQQVLLELEITRKWLFEAGKSYTLTKFTFFIRCEVGSSISSFFSLPLISVLSLNPLGKQSTKSIPDVAGDHERHLPLGIYRYCLSDVTGHGFLVFIRISVKFSILVVVAKLLLLQVSSSKQGIVLAG